MPISFTRYVDITSGVIGANTVAVRQLIGRLFTANPLVPTGSFVEFESADEVGQFFGTSSQEYFRAVFYFGWISKTVTRAQKISFARWVNVAVAPLIFGTTTPKALADYQAITAGTFNITLNGVTNTVGPLNLSSAGSLAAVATAIQTAINAFSGSLWTAATVQYDPTTNRFNFAGGVAAPCTISVVDGTQQLAAALGWTSAFPATIISAGAAAQDVPTTLAASAAASNNFGSFLFIPTLTLDEAVSAAQWADAQNVDFRFCVAIAPANADTWSPALIGFGGTDMALVPLSTEYPEMVPMIQEAATDYSQLNATSNYMYQIFPLTPSVTDDADADTYDALRINYYGVTQESGNLVAFWQRGLMCGGVSDPTDENTFSNESWFKSAAGAAIMNLLLALSKIPANSQGRAQLLSQLQGVVQQAIFNGTISVGKALDTTQIAAIGEITGDTNAWRQVQTSGYWLDVSIAPFTNPVTSLTEYRATYTLVYSKDDVVRTVIGQDVLV